MARGNMIVSVVDVGQGQCTFVEIWNTANTKIVETLLFDCGTDHPSTSTQTNLQYIADQVQKMDTPTISCIFFSHSDKDHISLTIPLLDKFTTKPVVGKVWYAGDYDLYKKYSTNVLKYLVDNGYCASTDLFTVNSDYTGYSKVNKKFEFVLWKSSDDSVHVYPIVGNVLSDTARLDSILPPPKKKTRYAEQKNRVSLICGLYYRGFSYVICGDATNKTMAASNGVFEGGTTVFSGNVMTTLPHHGSRATGFAVASSGKASSANKAIVKTFATDMNSETLTVSAYYQFGHPSMELMNEFIPRATTPILIDPRLNGKNVHQLNGFYDLDLTFPTGVNLLKYYYIFETQTNTYSTKYGTFGNASFGYNLGTSLLTVPEGVKVTTPPTSINMFACWIYQVNTTGSTAKSYIDGVPNLGAAYFTSGPTSSVAAVRSDGQATSSSVQQSVRAEKQPAAIVQFRVKQRTPVSIHSPRFARARSFSI